MVKNFINLIGFDPKSKGGIETEGFQSAVLGYYFKDFEYHKKYASPEVFDDLIRVTKKQFQSVNDPVAINNLLYLLLEEWENGLIEAQLFEHIVCTTLRRILNTLPHKINNERQQESFTWKSFVFLSLVLLDEIHGTEKISPDNFTIIADSVLCLVLNEKDGGAGDFYLVERYLEIMKYGEISMIVKANALVQKDLKSAQITRTRSRQDNDLILINEIFNKIIKEKRGSSGNRFDAPLNNEEQ
jgi:hypothetical protein